MLEKFVPTPSELEFKDHNLLLTKMVLRVLVASQGHEAYLLPEPL